MSLFSSKTKKGRTIPIISKLFAIPVAIICMFCIATFFTLYTQYRQQMEAATQQFTTAYFNTAFNEFDNTIPIVKWFEKNASLLLQSGNYEYFILVDEHSNRLAHVGLPYPIPTSPHWDVNNIKESFKHIDTTSNDILLAEANGNRYWIIASSNNQWHTIIFLKILLWGFLGVAIAAIMISKASKRIHSEFISPIFTLNKDINKIILNNFEGSFTPPKNPFYKPLLSTIKQLLDINLDAKESLKNNIESATQEIRETLESVEIQNIELDIERKKALQASNNKSELLASTSHEIRTPLNGILGFTHLLLKTDLNDTQKDYLATIEQSAQSLLTVINDIIDYSRLETGVMSFEYKPINIRELIAELFQFYAPNANESHLRLIQWIDTDLPEILLGDPLRLRQVLNNLIQNLLTLSNRGDLILESKILEKNDSKITLSFRVINPSAYISPQQKTQLEAVLSTNKDLPIHNTTGISLMIAKTLAERMRGKVELLFDQEIPTFSLSIELGLQQSHSGVALSFDSKKIQVLICDCNQNSQKELKLELLRLSIPAALETNIENLPRRIQQGSFNLILIECVTQGLRFSKSHLLENLIKIQHYDHIHIAIIAPSNLRRMLKNDIGASNVSFIQRPLLSTSIMQLLQIVAGVMPDLTNQPSSKPLRILVADDNPSNSKLVCAFLQQEEHTIITVDNGKKAVEAFLEDTPDIIFMDVQMPEMDGLQATMEIRAHEKPGERTPIIALTANTQTEQRARILRAGMDDYLTKPVSDSDLKHALSRWKKLSTNAYHSTPAPNLEKADSAFPVLTSQKIILGQSNLQLDCDENDEVINRKIFSLSESLKITNNNANLAKEMLTNLLHELPNFRTQINDPHAAQNDIAEAIHKLHGGAAYSGLIALKKQAAVADIDTQKNNNADSLQKHILALTKAIDEAISFGNENDISTLFEQ